ncbi:MAG: hypothetical protein GTO24_10365 [candidate division Zixibacteria bacterium]|nr:hypothetical protein [candidate division Zixibacteria bacterium]
MKGKKNDVHLTWSGYGTSSYGFQDGGELYGNFSGVGWVSIAASAKL